MFGYKFISKEKLSQLEKKANQVQEELNFSPSQDYASVGNALTVQLDRFANHESAMKSFIHKFVDAMEDIWDEEKVIKMLSCISSVINSRIRKM